MHWHAPRSDRALPRHALVRLDPTAWRAWLASSHDEEPLLRGWAERGWPLIARRAMPGEQGVALGLPLPPAQGKRRIAVTVPAQAIIAVSSLPTLSETMDTAPAAWRPVLRDALALAEHHKISLQVFGSLAWQHLTGLAYLSPGSDLDLAWSWPTRSELPAWLAALAAIDARAPMRLDGELIDAHGAGVNWRELLGDTPELACKSLEGLRLLPREKVFA